MTASKITVSVIICTRDRAPHLRETLMSLAQVRVPEGWTCELIIADNGSTDETPQVVREAVLPQMTTVRHLLVLEPGLSHARNAATQAAQGQVILFTDDDVRFPLQWIEGMAGPILEGMAEAVAGGVTLAPHLERPWLTPGHWARLASTENMDPACPDSAVGANMAFARFLFERLPGFDIDLGAGSSYAAEDTLFTWQVRDAGYRMISAFNVAVEHHFEPERLTRANLLRPIEIFGRTDGYMLHHWKHRRVPMPQIRLLKCRLWLLAWRLSHPKADRTTEGMSDMEIRLMMKVYLLEEYLRQRDRPPKYRRLCRDREAAERWRISE